MSSKITSPRSSLKRGAAADGTHLRSLSDRGITTTGSVTGGDPKPKGGQSETDAATTFHARFTELSSRITTKPGRGDYPVRPVQPENPSRRKSDGWSTRMTAGQPGSTGGKVSPPRAGPCSGETRQSYLRGPVWPRIHVESRISGSKFPAGGVDDDVYSAVGGACIARVDPTRGSVFQPYQCLTTPTPIPASPTRPGPLL